MTGSYPQWLRACSLVVGDGTQAIELAGPDQPQVLRIRFTVHYMATETPTTLSARVYNLSPQTVQSIVDFATSAPARIQGITFRTPAKVVLKVGYQANIGVVFQGQVSQLRIGKENATDSYLDIFAADGDAAFNWAYLRETLAKGYTATTVWDRANQSMQPWQVAAGAPPDGLGQVPSPRGKVCFGMTRDVVRDLAESNNFTWGIIDGQVVGIPKFTVRNNEAIVINSQTGMIGEPEQTEAGITLITLMNPAIRWGTKIQLNETDIQRLAIQAPGINAALPTGFTLGEQKSLVPPLNKDGFYVVLHASHIGDTRGNEWYTRIVCISIDPTAIAPTARSVPLPPPRG